MTKCTLNLPPCLKFASTLPSLPCKMNKNVGQRCWHDFVMKDATVKQITLNVTDMNKINIVNSQAVLEVFSFNMDTRWKYFLPLVNSLVKNRLFKTAPDIDEPPFQFTHTMYLSMVDTTLHDSPDHVMHRNEIWAAWMPQVGRKKVWRFLTQQFNCCTCSVCRCTVLLEHKVVTCISLAAV